MKLKKQVREVLQQEITGRLKPGDELVVIGAVALEGTRLLAKDKKTMLEMRFSQGFIQDMLYARERYGVQDLTENGFVWKMAEAAGADVIYPMGEGGFLSGLWKVAEVSGTGLVADFRIPAPRTFHPSPARDGSRDFSDPPSRCSAEWKNSPGRGYP